MSTIAAKPLTQYPLFIRMMLRHTYRTVAADVGVDEMLAHFLMGHAPEGISQRYVARMMLNAAPVMREAQRKISRRILELLGPSF